MTPNSEIDHVSRRSRGAWLVPVAAIAALALIAVLAASAFIGLDLLRRPVIDAGPAAEGAPIVAPAPTTIRPELHAPPSEWDDNLG